MIYYFVAYFGEKKALCYDPEKNNFTPYHLKLYRKYYKDIEVARFVARRAKHKNPDKRKEIYVDCEIINN